VEPAPLASDSALLGSAVGGGCVLCGEPPSDRPIRMITRVCTFSPSLSSPHKSHPLFRRLTVFRESLCCHPAVLELPLAAGRRQAWGIPAVRAAQLSRIAGRHHRAHPKHEPCAPAACTTEKEWGSSHSDGKSLRHPRTYSRIDADEGRAPRPFPATAQPPCATCRMSDRCRGWR